MNVFASAAIFACLSFGGFASAQEPPQSTPPSQPQGAPPSQESPADAPKVSLTGCLTKGTVASQYLLTEQKTGQKVPFAGPVQLDKYVNQTVQLTGTVAEQGAEKVFKPQSINQVSPTCEKGQ